MSFSDLAQGHLIDRGGGLIYDSDLNITWLSDANLAKGYGAASGGQMNWFAAMFWVNNLSYGGFDD
jgi:hypothetical protein